uniref:Cysteine rich with EGF like domains 1 n=1 Tax=Pipistrellus kuhlii TaxID=59472 RepID=A0A7J7WC86_PIPKU|nr:cysteine rich with EGF like domains 1 [Pipistrellus kuhlii]
MAPRPPRDLVPALVWGLSLFFSLPGPVWLQPSPPPQASPPTQPHPCHTCRGLVDSFNKGLERTIRDNFGGGNTAWEEEKLSKYKDSLSWGCREALRWLRALRRGRDSRGQRAL